MNARGLRRYIDDLLSGRRPRPFEPDDAEAAQIRTAIDLRAAQAGSDVPRQEFLTGLHSRLAAQMDADPPPAIATRISPATRRQVMVGTSAAAAAAVAAVAVDRLVVRGDEKPVTDVTAASGGELTPNQGTWQPVAESPTLPPTGSCIHSRLGLWSDSSGGSATGRRRCRGYVLIRAAACGSTNPTTSCAARATRHRSRRPVRC